jgi:hypothetical protein
MPTKHQTAVAATRSIVAEYVALIESAELKDLQPVDADSQCKKNGRGTVGVQGMILDAMADGRLEVVDAHRLLCAVNQKLNGNTVGLCRVTPDGDVMAMGSAIQGG